MIGAHTVAIMVSIDYGDYLSWTLPANCDKFDRAVVVTTQEDSETQAICRSVENTIVLLTERLHLDGAAFNKAAMVREAQELVHEHYPESWVLILDADILLPTELSDYDITSLDRKALYGLERIDYETFENWQDDLGQPYAFRMAGYFQLYFDKGRLYPPSSPDCRVCDIDFQDLFESSGNLPGCRAVKHLGVELQNSAGRRTVRWPTRQGARVNRSPRRGLDPAGDPGPTARRRLELRVPRWPSQLAPDRSATSDAAPRISINIERRKDE